MKYRYIALLSFLLIFSCHNGGELKEKYSLAHLINENREKGLPEEKLEEIIVSRQFPDSREAALMLIEKQETESRFREAEKTARKSAKLFIEDQDILLRYARLAFKTGKDRQFLSDSPDHYDDPELAYYNALMEYRQEKSLQTPRVRDFIYTHKNSLFHSNFYKMAERWQLPTYQKENNEEKSLLLAKSLLYTKQYSDATDILLPYSAENNEIDPGMAEDLRLLLLRNKTLSNRERGDLAVEIAERQKRPESSFLIYMTAARLYSLSGDRDLASLQTHKASVMAQSDDEKDLAAWYQLNDLEKAPFEKNGFRTAFTQIASLWHSPSYFDDILEDLEIKFLNEKNRDALIIMADTLAEFGTDSQSAACAWSAWLLSDTRDDSKESERLLKLARQKGRWKYEGVAASSRLGLSPAGLDNNFSPAESDIDRFILSFLEIDDVDRLLIYLEKYSDQISNTLIARCSEYLMSQEMPYKSVKLAALHTEFDEWNRELLKHNYPVLHDDQITNHAASFKIDPAFVKAVIRVESAWDAGIFSHAGAVGLMQLMPSTAAEIANKLDIDSPDLMIPEDNILLGSYYLNWLRERDWTENWADILAAYNAGGGNLRQWKRNGSSRDPLLFIELIPIEETRHYVKKVLTAAYWYSDDKENFPERLIYSDF